MSSLEERYKKIARLANMDVNIVKTIAKAESNEGRNTAHSDPYDAGIFGLNKYSAQLFAKNRLSNNNMAKAIKDMDSDKYRNWVKNNPEKVNSLVASIIKDAHADANRMGTGSAGDIYAVYTRGNTPETRDYLRNRTEGSKAAIRADRFQKLFENSSPNPLTIQGTPETTTGVLQQETPKVVTEMFQPMDEKEELAQLRKEQEPEFTPDLINELLSQGGQSQEVMTRRPKSYDEMSFRDAFNQAWRDKGEGDVFNWKGKPYLLKRK